MGNDERQRGLCPLRHHVIREQNYTARLTKQTAMSGLRAWQSDRAQSRGATPAQDVVSRNGARTLAHVRGRLHRHRTDAEESSRSRSRVSRVGVLRSAWFGWSGLCSRIHTNMVVYRGIGYDADAIPEKSAQKIFRAADQILRAGRDNCQEQSH